MTEHSIARTDPILVGGAGGFIGGWLVRYLHENGYSNLRAIDIKPLDEWHQVLPGVENRVADLRDLDACREAVSGIAHVYNLAEVANWPFIRRGSLLSTKALLDMADLHGDERERIECRQRLEHVELPNGVQLRDQKPMPANALKKCLVGMTPSEWYALINSQVFFWLDVDRLNRQRGACEPRPQVVLEVDTARLLTQHAERIALSPINTGNARRRPAKRGRCTFVPYWVWVESGWSSETEGLGTRSRGRSHQPVELTVANAVSDIMSFVVRVHRLGPGETFCPPTDG